MHPVLATIKHTGTQFTLDLFRKQGGWVSRSSPLKRKPGTLGGAVMHIGPCWRDNWQAALDSGLPLVTLYRDPLRTLASWKNRDLHMKECDFLYRWEIWANEIQPQVDYVFAPTDRANRVASLAGLNDLLGTKMQTNWAKQNVCVDRTGLHAALDRRDIDGFTKHFTPRFIDEVQRYAWN